MTNSDESYMTYVIYDQLGMVIYDQHNFSTNFVALFMAIFNSLNCNAGIQVGQEWRKRKYLGGGKFIYRGGIIALLSRRINV